MFENIISEINSAPLLMRQSAIQSLELICHKIIKGEKVDIQQHIPTKYAGISIPDMDNDCNPFDEFSENSIAVIPIIGPMLKYGSYNYMTNKRNPGMDDYANLLRMADSHENIIGTIPLLNTPGGTTHSIIQLEDALRNRTKPCVGIIDGMCCSAGAYVASFCDHIAAINPMCEIGSIGVQTTLLDFSELYKNLGITQITVRPPESKFKNSEYDEALAGNTDRLINEHLTPFANHFQNVIKTNRPTLNMEIEGIVEGKVFYANDAIKYGLIDSISNFEGVVQIVRNLYNEQQSIYSQFK